MSDALTIAEFEEQHLELLPSRTVLSVLSLVEGLAGELGLPGGNDAGMVGTPGSGENVENTVEVPLDSGTPTQP